MSGKFKKDLINTIQGRKIRDIKSVEGSKAFCMKPWVHLFVSHYGTVVPCCATPWGKEQALGEINEQTVQEIWNGKKMRDFRVKMLKDKKDSRCWQCYESEKVGLFSDRIDTNLRFGDKLDWALNTAFNGFSADSKPVHWDLRITNLCNFKCRICGHHSSSQWYDDAKALGLLAHDTKITRGPKDFDRLMQQLDFVVPDLEAIYFAGGEPLIMEEHYRILQLLIERKKTNIRLDYNTNFSQTIFKGHDLFELWSQFETVNVLASLDGSGKRGELQRSGQTWSQTVANRERMIKICPNVNFMVTPTINILNVLHISDFHKEWTEKGLIQIDEFMPHCLRNPEEYSICVLPKHLKLEVEKKLNAHLIWMTDFAKEHPPKIKYHSPEQFEKIKDRLHWGAPPEVSGYGRLDIIIREFQNTVTFMNSADKSEFLPKFLEKCAQLDKLRKEDTPSVFPELISLWD